MFVSVVFDIASEDHLIEVQKLLGIYGFSKIQEYVYETNSIKENTLSRLKRDIDKATDSFDTIRFYQYPVENTLVITSLKRKQWRKTILNP